MPFRSPHNLQISRTPFEVVSAQVFSPIEASSVSSRETSRFPVGPLGVRELASWHSNTSPYKSSFSSFSAFLCCQRKGQLIVSSWENLQNIGCCPHGVHTSVAQCIVTETLLLTRIQCEFSEDALESDHNVYVWDAETFERLFELHGHTARVTSIAVHPVLTNLVVTTALDYMTCVWNISKKAVECLWDVETRSLGTITHLEWILHTKVQKGLPADESLLISATDIPLSVWRWDGAALSQVAATPISNNSAVTVVHTRCNPQSSHCTVYTGSTDGYVRKWTVDMNVDRDTFSIEMFYQTKLHHASINHLLANERINVSGSLYSGVALYHCQKGMRANFEEIGGVSSMFLDDANKLLLVGTVNGYVWVISYANFELADGNAKKDETTALYRLCTLKNAITGMLLELEAGKKTWKQLLTVSSDGYIIVLDYTLRHFRAIPAGKIPLKDFPSVTTTLVVVTPFQLETEGAAEKLLVAHVRHNTVSIIDYSQKNSVDHGLITLPQKFPITCVRWDPSRRKMFIAAQRDAVHAYVLDREKSKSSSNAWRQTDFWNLKSHYSVSLSNAVENVIVVCLTDNPNSLATGRGWLGILLSRDLESNKDAPVLLTPLEDSVPFSATLLKPCARGLEAENRNWSTTIVIQNTKGIIQIFSLEMLASENDIHVTSMLVLGTSVPTAVSDHLKSERRRNNFSCKPLYVVDYENASTRDVIRITWVDNSLLFSTRIYTLLNYKSVPSDPVTLPKIPGQTPSNTLRELHYVGGHRLNIVISYNNCSYTLLLSHKPDDENTVSIFALDYTGEVLQYNVGEWSVKEKPSIIDQAEPNKRVCVCVSNCLKERYVAFGYYNGLIQLLDASDLYVFARLWTTSATLRPLCGLWCFEKEVIAHDDNGGIYATSLHPRFILNAIN